MDGTLVFRLYLRVVFSDMNEKVRITAQLIDAATDEHLWAESYDRNVSDIFSIQREVAMAIADVLNATLSIKETQQLDQTPTANLEAYDLYLRANSWLKTGIKKT